jgi:flagellar biosynthesis/type III secretory pathway protein FliH
MFSSERAWVPEQIPVAAFELPEFDVFGADDAPDAGVSRHELEAAVRQALAEREADEQAARERLQAEAYAAGVEAGRAEAEEAARVALGTALEALWLAAEEVRAGEARWLAALEDNVAALAAGAARLVVAREVAADDALVRELAQRAAAEFPQDHALQIRVNPADLAAVKAAFAESPRAGEVRFTPDARVERGGAVVEGRDRIVDGRVDTALERVYRTLSGHHA